MELNKIPQPYPNPELSTITSMFTYSNLITDGWLFVGFLLIFPIALFILFKAKELKTSDSLALSFFLTLFLGTYPWAVGLVAGKILGLLLVFFAFSMLYSFLDD